MKEIFNGSVCDFGSASSIWVTIGYEKKRNGADMQYRFNYKIRLSNRSGGTTSSASYQNNVQGKFYLNNVNVYTKSVKSSSNNWSFEYTTEWFNVEDKTTGTVPFKFTIKDTQNSSWCNYSSNTFQLEISPAGSDFKTLSNFNIGQPFTITANKYNEDFYDKLVIKIGSESIKTINNTGTSIQVDFTSSELNKIYDLTNTVQNTEFTFELSSYEDSSYTTQIGVTNTKVVKGYIIASNPVISNKSAIDTNSKTTELTGNNTKLIKYNSNVKVSVVAAGQNKATIKSVTINGITATLINGAYVVNFNATTINTFNIVINDSRGFQTTDSITASMINYIPLTINADVKRNTPTDGRVKISYSGNYYNGSFGSVSNTLITQYRFKEKGVNFTDNDEWIDMAPAINANKFNQNNLIVDNVDYQKLYQFQIRAIDKLNTWFITSIIIPKGEPTFWWNENTFDINGLLKVDNIKCKNLLYTPYTEKNKLTITATKDDYYIETDYRVYLEAGKNYTFSCEADGTFGGGYIDTVEVYLLMNKGYDYIFDVIKIPFTFTPEMSGEYYLRIDVNKSGTTHSFWNFQIQEGTGVSSEWAQSNVYGYIDSGWINAKLKTAFNYYNNQDIYKPRYRKIGNCVNLSGIITPTNVLVAGSETEIFTLPSEFRPASMPRYCLCQGSGLNRWLLTINTNGKVTFSRYGLTSNIDAPVGCWLPFDITFMI